MLKQIPEDFVVEEMIDLKLDDNGEYAYFLLEKRGMTTEDAVHLSAKKLNVDPKFINIAGTKDRHAVTRQAISVHRSKKQEDVAVSEKISLKYLGRGKERLNLGSNLGNRFTITVRNLDSERKISLGRIINYFDEQRFSKNNVEIGRLLLKGKWKDAADLIEDKRLAMHLKKNPTDFAGALREIPKNTLKMYVHSLQSKIWNDSAAILVEKAAKNLKEVAYSQGRFIFPKDAGEIKQEAVPIVGFGTELSGEMGKIIEWLLKKEKISSRDFIIRSIKELSSEGGERELLADVADLTYEWKEDELNSGKRKCVLSFSLPKGSYATMVVKSIFE